MPSISFWEILIILALVVLIFGPGRFGLLGKSIVKAIRSFKREARGEDME